MGYFLPQNHKFNHEYSFFLQDYLAKMNINGEKYLNVAIKFQYNEKEKEKLENLSNLSGEELYKYLIENGFEDEVNLLTYKHIFIAVLSDFCHFIHTALVCSEKGKLSVTYSLLRKPFKDYLFIFEWMLATPKEFLQRFNSKDSYAKIAVDKVSPKDKKKIIDIVIEKISFPLFTTEFIYDIRYNKKISYGFEPIWQKANHIITSHKYYRTEEGNLNFVFSNLEDKLFQWSKLYFLLPLLLFYCVRVCSIIFHAIDKENVIDINFLKRATIGFIIGSKNNIDDKGDLEKYIQNITLSCSKCNKKIKLNNEIVSELTNYFETNCHCGNCIQLFHLD